MFGCQFLKNTNEKELDIKYGRVFLGSQYPPNGKRDRSLEESPELWSWGAGLLPRKGEGTKAAAKGTEPSVEP